MGTSKNTFFAFFAVNMGSFLTAKAQRSARDANSNRYIKILWANFGDHRGSGAFLAH